MGKGQSPQSLSPTLLSGEPCLISSDPFAFCHLSGDVSGEPPFEGFPLAGEGFDPEIAIPRISVLQAAKRCCLTQSSGSSLLSLPSRSGEASSDALVRTPALVGLCKQVLGGPLDSRDRTGPFVVA